MKRDHLVRVQRHYFSGMDKPIKVRTGMTINGNNPDSIRALMQDQGITFSEKVRTLYVKPDRANHRTTFMAGIRIQE